MIREREYAALAGPADPASAASRSSLLASTRSSQGARRIVAADDRRVRASCSLAAILSADRPLRREPERRQGAAVLRQLRRAR